MNALHANFLVGKLFKSLFNSLNRTVNIRFDNDVERFDFALGNMAEQILQADLGQVFAAPVLILLRRSSATFWKPPQRS